MNSNKMIDNKQCILFLGLISDALEDAIVVVDKNGFIIDMSHEYRKFLKIEGNVIGKHVTEVIENTRLHLIPKTGRKEFADLQQIKGQTIVATRVPIVINGEIVGAIGKVLFKDTDDLSELNKKVRSMEGELVKYKSALSIENTAKYDLENIITKNEEIIGLKEKIVHIAKTNSDILIQGESGTGKELFAHSIYRNSKRLGKPFVKVNCSAIPYELMESELFGYEEGAFTGARRGGKIGKFEAADSGIIFLDEIGELPLNMQGKLLRVLQEREIEKIGAVKEKKIDIRVIAVTNRDLEEMVKEGTFRLDLYHRLNVVSLYIPPLRDRVEDIDILSKYLVKRLAEFEEIDVVGISKETIELLKAYPWYGNVRELKNTLERAINFLEEDTVIEPKHLPPNMLKSLEGYKVRNLKLAIENLEREEIVKALFVSGGNKVEAAEKLGISRTNLYKKISEYKIDM